MVLPSFRMDKAGAESHMQKIAQTSNISEIVGDQIAGSVEHANRLVCDDKLMASMLVVAPNGKQHILEIVEEELVHYLEADQTFALRRRGRLANSIAQDHGFNGYSCLSYHELENAVDEGALFDQINSQIKQVK